jgi:hypothetical protein
MRLAFLIILILHGLISLLGFLKGFGFKEVRGLALPISKSMGLLWLTSAILFLIFGILYFANSKYDWILGIIAVVVSQVLVILLWKDAKFGTLPNIIILTVSIISFGFYNFQNLVQQETDNILSQIKIHQEDNITENTIKDLPEPVKNWLRNSGVIGKPLISVGKVFQKAEMKIKPDQDDWLSASAIQYTTIENPAFIWTVDVKMNSLFSFQGRDKFENGKGEMLIKINSLINVVNEQGEKIDEGSLQRYLGEMVWFPSLALSPYITWELINDTTAKATMTYMGTKGSGTFFFNPNSDVIKYSCLRYKGNEVDAKRHEWQMLINDYKTFDGIKVPSKMKARWKLEDGDWTWLKLEVIDIIYNENAVL